MKKLRMIISLAALLYAGLLPAQLPERAEDISPLLIGEAMPDIAVTSMDGSARSLADIFKEKPTVLVFYRGGWCPYCNVQLAALGQEEETILALGYQIVAISLDQPEKLRQAADKAELRYRLYSDASGALAKAAGIAFQSPEKYQDLLRDWSGGQNEGFMPVPAVFVLDTKGEILFEYINPNFRQRLSGELLLAVLGALAAETAPAPEAKPAAPKPKRPSALANGKFFEKNGRKYLYGGERAEEHFDITGYTLKDEQFHYGIGRERFPALLEPEFITVAEAAPLWQADDRFLLAQAGSEAKAYSIKDLTRHEVVNDVLDGKPVFAAYCILADLGAMYDRTIGGREYTFALSGYTYYDPQVWDGMDGFVMWDRETESLWWPLIGKAVSGKLKGTNMIVLDEQFWKQTTWQDIRENHADAQILKSGQDFERPTTWHRHYEDAAPVKTDGRAVAPRWGE